MWISDRTSGWGSGAEQPGPGDFAVELTALDEEAYLVRVRKDLREFVSIGGAEAELLPERA